MSKFIFILPASIEDSPYLNYYLDLLEGDKFLISWDRFKKNKPDPHNYNLFNFYSVSKFTLINYIAFFIFIISKINSIKNAKIISFTLQGSILLFPLLIFFYKNKYIVDIRDPSKVVKLRKITEMLIKHSFATSISSEAYFKWLNYNSKIYLSNNLHPKLIQLKPKVRARNINNSDIIISNIGFIRHVEENINLIKEFKNDLKFKLNFHGSGKGVAILEDYVKDNNINNVNITGKYKKEEEQLLYENSDIINIYISDTQQYSKDSMANRFLNGIYNGNVILTNKGTYMGELSCKYNLGPIVTKNNIKNEVTQYIQNYNHSSHQKGLDRYWENVRYNNEKFMNMINSFEIK